MWQACPHFRGVPRGTSKGHRQYGLLASARPPAREEAGRRLSHVEWWLLRWLREVIWPGLIGRSGNPSQTPTPGCRLVTPASPARSRRGPQVRGTRVHGCRARAHVQPSGCRHSLASWPLQPKPVTASKGMLCCLLSFVAPSRPQLSRHAAFIPVVANAGAWRWRFTGQQGVVLMFIKSDIYQMHISTPGSQTSQAAKRQVSMPTMPIIRNVPSFERPRVTPAPFAVQEHGSHRCCGTPWSRCGSKLGPHELQKPPYACRA